MMGRGARHHDRKKAICPKCYSEKVDVTGPTMEVKGIKKAPAQCGDCQHTWRSESRAIMALIR